MKHRIKILGATILLLLLCAGARGQHYLGVRGGYGGGLGRLESRNGYEMRPLFGGPSGGISWKYYSPVPVVGAVQADLQVVTKGFHRVYVTVTDGKETVNEGYSRLLTAVELPFFWHNHFYLDKRRIRLFLNLGVYGAYYLRAQEKGKDNLFGETNAGEYRPYTFRAERDNRFDYGLVGGAGGSYLFKRFEVFVEGRYSFGFADLMKAPGKYPGNTLNRTPVDMINVSAGIYYRLGKGGILAPPASRGRTIEKRVPIPPRITQPGGGSTPASSPTPSPARP